MEIYGTPSKETKDILLASVAYSEVIEGLNRYFTSEPRNNYISIWPTVNAQDFVLYEPEAWADILIEWLRKKHDIFYRPGLKLDQVEAARSAAKKEAKQECYKYLWDRLRVLSPDCDALKITDYEKLVDRIFYEMSLIAGNCKECQRKHSTEKFDYIWRTNKAEEEVKKLKEQLDKVEDAQKEAVCKDIMNYIRHESSRNGFELPEEIDGEPLTIKRVFHDLLELMRKRGAEIKKVNDQRWKDLRDINKALGYDGMDGHVDDFAKAVKARAECVKRALGEESDINALIRDWCTKNDVIPPSRYFSDKACVEYLFSVIKLDQKDRSVSILQDLYRDIFKKQPDGLSAEDIANKILDKMLKTEDLLHKSVDSVNKECKATGKLMVEDYSRNLKTYILKDIKKLGYPCDGLQTKSIEEIIDWIITMDRDVLVNSKIENLRGQIKRLKDLINAMNEEVGDM